MKFFVDSTDSGEIERLDQEYKCVDGVTTNPSLLAKAGQSSRVVFVDITQLMGNRPVSAEVIATDWEGMVAQGQELREIASNIVVKVPVTKDGLKACRILSDDGIEVNVTLCFQPIQALLAARAGARYISPFVGRLDDRGEDGMELIRQIRTIYDHYDLKTEILVASIRNMDHIIRSAELGADVVTIPPAVFDQLLAHELTERGLETFLQDWKQTGQQLT